ncbi:hypothetical protein FLAG1_04778 [Fusarium langsethiae]|uniref:Uncharacterized protein n=1 Tax=Fusarium langsethiae TaxID=179993 RepID=A0A0M9EYR0_FUSLA|nr:hypothetical protein FLAG1_04778 [Fusarium langsethiae]GKU01804.1 unnamed protein product [Fusarium langsethiae]GKU16806.1 unnamed protein product [Fusarium langsethiae]
MVRFTPLAALALVPLAQARFDWLYARNTIAQCPPCTMEGKAQECSHTVTVTERAGPYETVTVSDPKGSYHTVTFTEYGQPGKTVTITQNYQEPVTRVVYVSHGETLNPPKETVTVTKTEASEHVVTKQVDVYPGPGNSNGNGFYPGPKTVTISNGHPAPSADSPGYDGAVVTKIVGDGDNVKYPNGAHTVTVIDDGKVKTLTYTDGHYNTVTLKDGKKVIKTVTTENTNNYVVTKTAQEGGKYHTVIVKPEPTVSTIINDNGDYVTTIVETPHTYTLTAPIRYGSPSPTDDDCETITRTATYTGQPEVEIIVYDPESGDSTCTKEDGQPCRHDYENDKPGYDDNGKGQEGDDSKGQYEVPAHTKVQSGSDGYNSNVPVYTKIRTYGDGDTYTEVYGADPTGCESFAVSTSISTIYNTVVVTVEPSSTVAADDRLPKKARSPLSVRR